MNGQRDKKGQKLTKSEGWSSKGARGVTFWSFLDKAPRHHGVR